MSSGRYVPAGYPWTTGSHQERPFLVDDVGRVYGKVVDAPSVPLGDQSILDLSASTALTIPDGARAAAIQVFSQKVRIRFTSVAPTASVGHVIYPDDMPFWVTSVLSGVRLIEETASATAFVTYFA